jgi:RND family efflux transporter MFP subunit
MKPTTSILLTCLTLFSCSLGQEGGEEKAAGAATEVTDEITQVKAVQLKMQDFHHETVSNGTISARRKADLRFQTSEPVAAIYVGNGDKVSKGQKIAMLDRFKLHNSLVQAGDNLAKSRLELQDVLIGQGYTLADSAKVPAEVMKIARLRSNYDQSLNQYEVALYNYDHSVLYAPFGGVVANLFTKEYNIPASSEPFCTIIDSERPEVVFMILENELSLVRSGDKVVITPYAFTGSMTEGRIMEINPLVDKNGMVRIKAQAGAAKDKLYDGMNVKVRIRKTVGRQLVIPKEALVLRTNKKVVFTLKDGKALWNYVQTGMENSAGYVVTEGLNENDSVIYEGNINLAHESPVKLLP